MFFPFVLPEVGTCAARGCWHVGPARGALAGRRDVAGGAINGRDLRKAARDAGGLLSPPVCLAETSIPPLEIMLWKV